MRRPATRALLPLVLLLASCALFDDGSGDVLDPPTGALPDLIVESVDFQLKDPAVGMIVKVNPTVRNIGDTTVDLHHEEGTPFWVSRYIEGATPPSTAEQCVSFEDQGAQRYLAPGESRTMANLSFRYPGAGHEIEIVADADEPDGPYVVESDETNNSLSLQIDDYLGVLVPATVRLVPSQTSQPVGVPVVVRIEIEDAVDLATVSFQLRYDDVVLRYSHAVEGDFLAAGGNTMFLASDTPDGSVVVGLSLLGATEGVTGSGLLMELTFQAIGPGDCGFQFDQAVLKDPESRPLPAVFVATPVQVTP